MQVQSTRLPAGDSQDTADSDIDFVRSKVDVPGHNSLTRYEIKSFFFFFVHPYRYPDSQEENTKHTIFPILN